MFNPISGVTNFVKAFTGDADEVSFSLFTPKHRKLHVTKLRKKDLRNKAPFKFIIHGWRDSPASDFYKKMTAAYFRRNNYNIVHVNWSVPASVDYYNAVRYTKQVGKIVADFILHMRAISNVKLKRIHLIGHSLGAHVSGVAGNQIFESTGRRIYRITGLDPAGPIFEQTMDGMYSRRLRKDDARMVDIVHTDGGLLGFLEPIGTIDFYPNGGVGPQPGCPPPIPKFNILTLDIESNDVSCSHAKSHEYFIKSINSKRFSALKCNSWSDFGVDVCIGSTEIAFGEDAPIGAAGTYYFRTEPLL